MKQFMFFERVWDESWGWYFVFSRRQYKVFWGVAPCCLVKSDRRFGGAFCGQYYRPDYGYRKHIWNVGYFLQEYTEQYLARRPCSEVAPVSWSVRPRDAAYTQQPVIRSLYDPFSFANGREVCLGKKNRFDQSRGFLLCYRVQRETSCVRI